MISPRASRDAAWGTVAWGSAALYAIYRTVGLIYGVPDLPMTGCFGLEVLLVPLLMPVADGILLAWVVVELRNAGLGDSPERERLDVPGAVALMPAAALACAMLMPGRYVATAGALVFLYLTSVPGWLAGYFRWQLGWGVIDLQAAGLLGVGAAGALAWSRGTFGSMLGGYARLLRARAGTSPASSSLAGCWPRAWRRGRTCSCWRCRRRPGCWRRPTATRTTRRCPSVC